MVRGKVGGIVYRLLNPGQGQLTVRPEQRQTLQRLRQRQQITFVTVAQQLTGRVVELQLMLFGPGGQPARQLCVFRRLATDLDGPLRQGGKPRGILLGFGQLIPAKLSAAGRRAAGRSGSPAVR